MSVVELDREDAVAPRAPQSSTKPRSPGGAAKSAWLFVVIFFAWAVALAWFHPRLWSLLDLADTPWQAASISYFILFAELAWLYGFYNIGVVVFAIIERKRPAALAAPGPLTSHPPVAVLYATCDDFVERSAQSCVDLTYGNCHIYILDDSSIAHLKREIDAFAARNLGKVTVVRRPDRRGFKAGNLNHALANVVHEPFFAVVDADEILPHDFIEGVLRHLLADDKCGFVQANHRSRPDAESQLARDMGIGIDIHWKWYQPLRNRNGFVMFLGHGAILRRACWEEVGGFPELVSEDLAYAIALRERGYHGVFAEDVVCLEEFPATVSAFRVRHVKWTRGTCEFLHRWMFRLLISRRVTTAEKLDILFPTLNLPLTFFFFLFMTNVAFVLPLALGQPQPLTLVVMDREWVLPSLALRPGVERVHGIDFWAITLMTLIAPILCFIIELARKPLRLLRFLTHSTALYAALSPLSFISVVGYALTGRAQFFVTGAVASAAGPTAGLIVATHPASRVVQALEFAAGAVFFAAALLTLQVSFLGIALGFMLLPVMHDAGWRRGIVGVLSWAPFALIAAGVALGASALAGVQPVFFGFGFHF